MAEYTWAGSADAALPEDFADIGGDAESVLDGSGNVKRPAGIAHTGRLTTSTADYVRMVRKPSGAQAVDTKSVHLRSTDTRGGYVARFTNATTMNIRKATGPGVGAAIGNYTVPFSASLSDTDYEMEFWLEEDGGTITFYAAVDGQACTGTAVTDSSSILTGGNPGWRVSAIPEADGLMGAFADTVASSGATLTTPTATSITQTTATIGCTSDTAEGLVHAGVTTTATPPSDAQLIAGSGGGLVAAGSVSAVAGANTVGLTGLTADTGYFRHFIQSDGAGTATSTMLSPDATAGFTTLDNVPTITSVTPSTVAASTNPVIAGTNFGATQGGGSVIISPTDDSSDVNAVTQTIGAWADDEITLDGVSFPTGTVHEGTLYLFVFNNDQEVNAAGETIAAYIAPLLTNPTQVNVGSTTVTPRVTTTVGNGTAYHVIFPQSDPDPNKEQIAAGNGADDQPAPFSDSMAVSAAGELTFPEVTGLDPAVAYRIGYTHNGDPNA